MRVFYKVLILSALLIHVALRYVQTQPSQLLDLYFYNSFVIVAMCVILFAPAFNDSISRIFLTSAVAFWGVGSLVSSLSAFYSIENWGISDICYSLFYPCAFIALPRILTTRAAMKAVEVLDSAIIGLGLSSLGAALLIEPVLPHFQGDSRSAFFAVLYPVGDLILISSVLTPIILHRISIRTSLVALGVLIFAVSDFSYLWLHVNGLYRFGSLGDDGWLLALLILGISLYSPPRNSRIDESLHPIFVALAIFLSATLLGVIAIRPGFFPSFIIIPALATLILAFVRMTIALRQAQNIGDERTLARTDELTGLPNRRNLMAELEKISEVEGALLLMDLDGFKPINDTYGHEVGDQILRLVSLRFSRALPHGSVLARLGGDEFGLILRGNIESIMEVALALRATLSYPFVVGNVPIELGVSIGVARNDGSSNLLKQADLAMYQAKREKSGVAQFQESG